MEKEELSRCLDAALARSSEQALALAAVLHRLAAEGNHHGPSPSHPTRTTQPLSRRSGGGDRRDAQSQVGPPRAAGFERGPPAEEGEGSVAAFAADASVAQLPSAAPAHSAGGADGPLPAPPPSQQLRRTDTAYVPSPREKQEQQRVSVAAMVAAAEDILASPAIRGPTRGRRPPPVATASGAEAAPGEAAAAVSSDSPAAPAAGGDAAASQERGPLGGAGAEGEPVAAAGLAAGGVQGKAPEEQRPSAATTRSTSTSAGMLFDAQATAVLSRWFESC